MPTMNQIVRAKNNKVAAEIEYKKLVYQFAKDCTRQGQDEEVIKNNFEVNGLLTHSIEIIIDAACEGNQFHVGRGVILK